MSSGGCSCPVSQFLPPAAQQQRSPGACPQPPHRPVYAENPTHPTAHSKLASPWTLLPRRGSGSVSAKPSGPLLNTHPRPHCPDPCSPSQPLCPTPAGHSLTPLSNQPRDQVPGQAQATCPPCGRQLHAWASPRPPWLAASDSRPLPQLRVPKGPAWVLTPSIVTAPTSSAVPCRGQMLPWTPDPVGHLPTPPSSSALTPETFSGSCDKGTRGPWPAEKST